MDDLGAEHLSELSRPTLQLSRKEPTTSTVPTSPSDVSPIFLDGSDYGSQDGKEKADATPENIKKIDDVIQQTVSPSYVNETKECLSINDHTGVEDDSSPSKQCMAFTIDFGSAESNCIKDSGSGSLQAAKYKNMVERFQNRHKRGASMSKIESEPQVQSPPATSTVAAKVKLRIREKSTSGIRDSNKRHSWSPRSSTHEPAVPLKEKVIPKLASKPEPKPRQFAPKSLAMQKALENLDFYCPEPPLENNNHCNEDEVSEAGTYTLDGDNYTEEQKELMNIDISKSKRPKDLPLQDSTASSTTPKRSNILEVNYYHDSTTYKPAKTKTSYLEKIKTKVRANFAKNTSPPPHEDCGTFTSITASGVLAKKSALDFNPGIIVRRKNSLSLSKSQIDSSEYVSAESKMKAGTGGTGMTDLQKSEYRLNVFTNQTDSQLLSLESQAESDGALLKTAQTKNDWIKEWARNARARSVASAGVQKTIKTNDEMTRSCGGEDMIYRNKHLDSFRLSEFDYSSDPNVSQQNSRNRPPKSPTKIPSPLHSIGRNRTASRTRASLQNLLVDNVEDDDSSQYLEKTQIAINNLQQNLSRRNSIKSVNSINSPKKAAMDFHQQQQQQHKRNLSLDYNPKIRKNSFDSPQLTVSPVRFRNQTQQKYIIDQTKSSIKQITSNQQPPKTSSPIRRSSSFSVKPLSAPVNRGMRQQQQQQQHSVYTASTNRVPLQKSASSNSFRKIYTDYDDNIEYYINDEDDLNNDYYSSEGEENYYEDDYEEEEEFEEPVRQEVPLTNTRYNKALLMRIERSKQKVAGTTPSAPPPIRNTPELPRRAVQSAGRSSMRQSMPRDTSLNRLKGEFVPNSLASAKKQILQTANTVNQKNTTTQNTKTTRVQPKYMDISKYKPSQGANFLRKNDAKSTLKPEIKRSPSNVSSSNIAQASGGLSRVDPVRMSNRSVRSASSGFGGGGRNAQNTKRDSSVSKQKEAELAMWKRRATYDPMKAAAEDRKRKEEAKRVAQGKSTERPSRSPYRRGDF